MFQNITTEFQRVFKTLRGHGKLSEKNIEDAIRQIKMSLLSADVNVLVVKDFIKEVREKALGSKVLDSLTPSQYFVKIVNEELTLLMGTESELNLKARPPVVIMCVGLQGSGKTTTAAKIAKKLSEDKHRILLVPADLRRPAAIEQLTVLGKGLNIDVYPSKPEDDAVNVSKNAFNQAAKLAYDIVLIDTAGRLHIDKEMMQEVASINDELKPQNIIFVADAMTGQDAVKSAKAFSELLPLTGVVLTKLDGDARGGAALSIRKVTGSPILFVGTGEKVEDLETFVPSRMASRILGMGDVLSLIEKATENIDEEEASTWAKKAFKKKLTLEDLQSQFKMIKKMGSMGKLLGMLPMGQMIKGKVDDAEMEKHIKVKDAIINSMTPQERRYPKVLNGSRRKRIAAGSGTEVSDINKLIKEFETMQKMMKKVKTGGMKNMMKMMNFMR